MRSRVIGVRFGSASPRVITFRLRRSACCCSVVGLLVLLAGCGGDDEKAAKPDSASSGPDTASATPKLVGRWERVPTCRELAHALDQANLNALAPSVLGDFFPGTGAREIPRKKDLCEGADPARRHSHFFSEDGSFGSLDQDLNRVDEDAYRIVDDRTVRIGRGSFEYRITDGDTLILNPVITAAARRRALAHPFEFSTGRLAGGRGVSRSSVEARPLLRMVLTHEPGLDYRSPCKPRARTALALLGPRSGSIYALPMASAELSRRVAKVVAYLPLSDLSDPQRREFHEALLDADAFEDLPGKWQAAILKPERNRPKLRLISSDEAAGVAPLGLCRPRP